MGKIRDNRHAVLLCVCYLAQLVIAPAQPAGLGAAVLVPLFLLGILFSVPNIPSIGMQIPRSSRVSPQIT